MDQRSIEAAYQPFVRSLREGGFGAPGDGWNAELVAAHVTRNNDLVAETAERVVAGERPSYDNSSSVDEEELAVYATSVGGLPGLADATEASARRLAAAWAALDEATGAYPVPARHRGRRHARERRSDPRPPARGGQCVVPPRHAPRAARRASGLTTSDNVPGRQVPPSTSTALTYQPPGSLAMVKE